jgi:citrate synthase
MEQTLTITDNRTGSSYTVPVTEGTVRATDLRQIKVHPEDFGLMSYDPALMNTASCRSAITYIDGDQGILRYCGYPIEHLAENCSFLEVAYLILFGELPRASQLGDWVDRVKHHTMLHENIKKFMDGFHHDAHPMGMLVSTVAALSTFYPEARNIRDPEVRRLQVLRLIGKMPTIAAYAYRHSLGLPYVYPDNELSYTENFMNML